MSSDSLKVVVRIHFAYLYSENGCGRRQNQEVKEWMFLTTWYHHWFTFILDRSNDLDPFDQNGSKIVRVEDLKDDKIISDMETTMKEF